MDEILSNMSTLCSDSSFLGRISSTNNVGVGDHGDPVDGCREKTCLPSCSNAESSICSRYVSTFATKRNGGDTTNSSLSGVSSFTLDPVAHVVIKVHALSSLEVSWSESCEYGTCATVARFGLALIGPGKVVCCFGPIGNTTLGCNVPDMLAEIAAKDSSCVSVCG